MEGNSINSFENLCKIFEMRIKLDKEKHIENMKRQERTEPKRAKAEQVEAITLSSTRGRASR